MLSSNSLGCLESGRVIFGRLFGEIPATPPPFPPLFFGLEISDFLAAGSSLSLVEEEMVELVEEEFVDSDLERKDRSCLSFLSLNKLSG